MTQHPDAQVTDTIHAWKSWQAQTIFALVVLAVFVVDVGSKYWAFKALADNKPKVVLPGLLQFRTLENTGAVFGLGSGQRTFFLVASIVAVAFVYHLFASSLPRQRFLHVMLGLIMGGAAGNFYDRLLFHHVRDFIEITARIADLRLWQWVFNVADMALVIGVLAIGLGWIVNRKAVSFHATAKTDKPQ